MGTRGADGPAPARAARARARIVHRLLAVALLAGCAAPRIVPIPAAGVQIDGALGEASIAAEGVALTVRPSAWRGSPWDLHDYVTPFLVTLSNAAAVPLRFDYVDLRLFDDSRFQYTALPPGEVERILRWRSAAEERLAAVSSPPPVIRRRNLPDPYWDRWWDGYGWPWYSYPGPYAGEVYARALPMGELQPAARLEGFVYFPRIRDAARGLTLEFHHILGDLPRVLTVQFVVERGGDAAPGS